MGLEVDTNFLISQAKADKYFYHSNLSDKPASIFSLDNLKEYQDELTIAGGIATAGLIGLSIISRKNILYLLNKSVKFKNLEQARAFGKTKIINALKKKNPYEQLIIINKQSNSIVAQAKGKKDFIESDVFKVIKPSGHFSIEHGHPTCCFINGKPASMPVSFEDYLTTMRTGSEDLISYDVSGKFSMLKRKPDFKGLSSKELDFYYREHWQIYDDVYLKKMLRHLPKEFHSITSNKELNKVYKRLKQENKLTKELDTKFQQAFNELKTECPELLYKIDKFWRMHADDLGVIYKTNYEYLKTRPKTGFEDLLNSFSPKMFCNFLEHLSGENGNILKEAIRKNDFETIKRICRQSVQTTSQIRTMSRNDFIRYMSDKLTRADKFDVKSLNDIEVRKLAKLLKTSEEQIRHMDKSEFKRLCVQTHPDRNPNDSMAHLVFIILNKIYQG